MKYNAIQTTKYNARTSEIQLPLINAASLSQWWASKKCISAWGEGGVAEKFCSLECFCLLELPPSAAPNECSQDSFAPKSCETFTRSSSSSSSSCQLIQFELWVLFRWQILIQIQILIHLSTMLLFLLPFLSGDQRAICLAADQTWNWIRSAQPGSVLATIAYL